jgi:hypothetical protein
MTRDRESDSRRIAVVGIAVLLAVGFMGTTPSGVLAEPPRYSFTPIILLNSAVPGGGSFTSDFEPSGINNRGGVAFTADLTTGVEGVFVARRGQVSQILRGGDPAPGGGTFGSVELGRLGLNDGGDVAVPFTLEPVTVPLGLNSGLYRFSHASQTLSAAVVPGVTPAPGGGTFAGVFFNTSINNSGDIVFSGIATGVDIDPTSAPGFMGMGLSLVLADKHGNLVSVARPGDSAPKGGTFDAASNGWINDGGDIAFGAHLAGEECVDIGSPFACGESVYLRKAATGVIESIAHQGDPAPGGGTYRLAFGPVLNSQGDIVFIGDLTPPPANGVTLGVFLVSKGLTTAVARPGDPMPGGGNMVSAGNQDATYGINNVGDVSFAAKLDTDSNGDGIADTGVYVSSRGSVHLVARTGTFIPSLGTIAYLGLAPFCSTPCVTGGVINNRGQVLFFATLSDGTGVLLLATPGS